MVTPSILKVSFGRFFVNFAVKPWLPVYQQQMLLRAPSQAVPSGPWWWLVARVDTPLLLSLRAVVASFVLLELSNSFTPLADLPASPVWVPGHPDDLSPALCPSSASFPGHPTSVSVKRSGGRKATSKWNRSPSHDSLNPHYTSDKRPRVSSPSSEASLGAMAAHDGHSPLNYGLSSPWSAMLPPSAADADTVSPGGPACQLPPPKPAGTVAERPTASNNSPTNSDSMECLQLPLNTAAYYDCDIRCNPDILIVGDSIVRQLTRGVSSFSKVGVFWNRRKNNHSK